QRDDIALEQEGEAVVSVVARLDDFSGLSRFTTGAYKIALLEAAVKLRRRAWQGREIPLEPESWNLVSSSGLRPDEVTEQTELLSAVQPLVRDAPTPHQRSLLLAVAGRRVPLRVPP